MTKQPRHRTSPSWLRLVAVGLGLLVVLYVLYLQFGVQPSLWDALTNGANY